MENKVLGLHHITAIAGRDNPGFSIDEPLSELGTHLKLPPPYEDRRSEIEKVLPALT